MYPTRASYRPLDLKSLRYMCSTPQKQPAAMVAFSAPSGLEIEAEASGFKRREVEVVKGRMSRVRKFGMVAAMRRMIVVTRRVRGEKDRMAVVFKVANCSFVLGSRAGYR